MAILLHADTESALHKLTRVLPQSLLLTGERGVGLLTIARSVAGNQLAGLVQPADKKGDPDAASGTISVEAIRKLYDQTRSRQTTRQVFIIDDADRMSPAAQGAFLKLLEEPSRHVHFILTSHAPQRLLPTVRSRLQAQHVRALTAAQTDALLDVLKVSDMRKRSQLAFIASGLPAELTRLVEDEQHFAVQAQVVGDARDFLIGTPYARLLIAQKYQSDRSSALQLIDSTIAITRRSLTGKPQAALIGRLEQLLELRDRIAGNGSIRLQLASVVL